MLIKHFSMEWTCFSNDQPTENRNGIAFYDYILIHTQLG